MKSEFPPGKDFTSDPSLSKLARWDIQDDYCTNCDLSTDLLDPIQHRIESLVIDGGCTADARFIAVVGDETC